MKINRHTKETRDEARSYRNDNAKVFTGSDKDELD